MKVKLKLDANTIQQALVDHAEKAVFALVVVGCLFFIYRAVTQAPPIAFQPEALSDKAKKAEEHLRATEAKPIAPADYKKVAEEIDKPIPMTQANIELPKRFEPSLIPTPRQRTKPALLPLKDLRCSAANGPFNTAQITGSRAAVGGSTMQGFRWVVMTGLADWRAQIDAYRMVFANTQPIDQQAETPEYARFWIERAEVGPLDRDMPPESSWTKISFLREMEKVFGKGTVSGGRGGMTDPVDSLYRLDRAASPETDFAFVFPLPPLAGRTWGPEVGHPPEIPWHDPRQPGRGLVDAQGKAAGAAPDAPPSAPPPLAVGDDRDPDAALVGGRGAVETGRPGQRPPVARGGAAGGGRGPARKTPAGRGGEISLIADDEPQYLLFRFFDFSVEPGKRYRYRAKLELVNPNHDVLPQYLERDDLRTPPYLETAWSTPTEPVAVPLDSRVLAAPPPGAARKEPVGTVTLLVVHFDAPSGMETYHEVVGASRGQWLNYLGQASQFAAADAGVAAGGGRGGAGGVGAAAPGETGKVDYETQTILLDFSGGTILPGKDKELLEPRAILVADAAGNLTIRNELDDRADYDRFIPPSPASGGLVRPKPGVEAKTPKGKAAGGGLTP